MEAGVRNKFNGEIVGIKTGDVMSQVTLKAGEIEVTSVMTTESVREAGFKEGDRATALIKAINVVLVK